MSDLPPPIPGSYVQDAPRTPVQPLNPGQLGGTIAPNRGGAILALGISSLVVLVFGGSGLVFAPCCLGTTAISVGLAVPAWVMANADIRAMREGRMSPSGRGLCDAGRICAIIAVVLNGLGLLGCLGSAAFFGLHGLSSGRPWNYGP